MFRQHLVAKALVFVNATVQEIFQWHLVAKALVLVNDTALEIFQGDLVAKSCTEKPWFW